MSDGEHPSSTPPGVAAPARLPRRRLSAQQRRDDLVRATVAVVATHGYQHASLTKIAEIAGVSKGLVWHYFADGNDLMTQTARTTLVRLREAVAADIDLTARVPDVIRAAIGRAAQLPLTHRDELTALEAIVGNLRTADGSALLGVAEYDDTHTRQAVLFRRGQQEGSLDATLDPYVMAVTYQGAVDTMLAFLRTHPELDPARYANSLADLLLGGYAAR